MLKLNAKPLQISRRKQNDQAFVDIAFPNGLLEIRQFSILVLSKNEKEIKYIIELHKYTGFSMIKFYPFTRKKHPKKYEIRGAELLGFCLKRRSILNLIYECTAIMINYLEAYPCEFIGYVGQVDSKDNIRNREKTQRSTIYNSITSRIFGDTQTYKIINRKIFSDYNIRLLRNQISEQQGKATKEQMKNYDSFVKIFESSHESLLSLMTDSTRKRRGA